MQYLKYIFAGLFVAVIVFALLMQVEAMTPEIASTIAGGVLALVFQYFPWLSDGYNKLPDDQQQLIMLGLMFLVVAGAFGLSCAGLIVVFVCAMDGAMKAFFVFFLAIGVNQGAHKILPKPGFIKRLAKK